jgi:hypothetical protein
VEDTSTELCIPTRSLYWIDFQIPSKLEAKPGPLDYVMPFDVASESSPEFLSSAASDNGPDSAIVKHTMLPSIVPTRPSPDSLTTLPEILSSLSLLESEEAELSSTLQELLANHDPVVSSLSRLHNLLPQLDELRADAYLLTRKVSVTAETADRIGGSVRALDEEMRRVREASDRVAQVMDLKVCSPNSGVIVTRKYSQNT